MHTENDRNAAEGAKTSVHMALFGTVASIVLMIVDAATFRSTGGTLFLSAQAPLFLALIFSVSAWVEGILAGNAAREEEEKKLLDERPGSRLLTANEDVRFTAKRAYDRYRTIAPYVVALTGASALAASLWKSRALFSEPEIFLVRGDALHLALISAIMMLFCVFTGAFFLGESRAFMCRRLRPVGAEFIAAFALFAAGTVAAVAARSGYVRLDLFLGKIVFWLIALQAAELVFHFAIEFYRPRTAEEERPLFESRLLSLFTEPGGVMRNVASALDYQFGFKVSGTWLYRFIERAFVPLLLAWGALFWLGTAIHEVRSGESGFRKAFGRIVDRENLTPGIYLSLPRPFGTLEKRPTAKLLETDVGESRTDDKGRSSVREIVLWTELHGGENDHFIVAVPQEKGDVAVSESNSIAFIRMSIPILYRISDLRRYTVDHADAAAELKRLGEQTVTEYLASASMDAVMSSARRIAEKQMRRKLQLLANEAGLGVEIVSLSILDAHPPTGGELDVAASYQNVIGAMEQKETSILEADAYAAKTAPAAAAEARALLAEANAYRHRVRTVAAAESARFTTQAATSSVMPEMFKLKNYLDVLENEGGTLRKFVVSSKLKDEIYELNFEENDRLDLLDAQIGNPAQ